jgi:hypothetical protein
MSVDHRDTDSSSVRPAHDELDLQSARMYYTSQYERVGRHEANRLTFSNYVIAASFVALGLLAGAESKQGFLPGGIPRAAVTIVVALANVFAILFAFRSRYWAEIHRKRVDCVLEYLSPDLVVLQQEADKTAGRREPDPCYVHSHIYQSCIHVLVIIAALAVGFFA